jgi:hypothetical protein
MRLGLKNLPRTNGLVDLAYSSNIEEKSFAVLTTDDFCYETFFFVIDEDAK